MANDSDFKADIVSRTAAQWTAINPHLNKNDLGIESDTGLQKVGIGSKWSDTPYLPAGNGLTDTITFYDYNNTENTVAIVNGIITAWDVS